MGAACNPYLPLYEYVPDGEPRVFGNRLYVYGSHDLAGGDFFCLGDYVVWSAPIDDLGSWRCDGISYRRNQDPHNVDGRWELFAPDVVQGADGRYYLYYCLRMQQEFGVAVSESPEGPFAFYGHIRRADGTLFTEGMPYDPAVLTDEDGKVYLYYGYNSEEIARKFDATISGGCSVITLAEDMLTVTEGPVRCLPRDRDTAGTGFEKHGYYEAPSIRKIGSLYYLVYSSEACHELCYAVSTRPTEGFRYGGVIVSNADLGLNGRTDPVCLPGNNHGGLVHVNGQFYIFYQRHTHCTQYSRQGCAEPVRLLEDGSIPQVEITTGGMSGGPLPAAGTLSAAYACHLTCRDPRPMLDYRAADPDELPAVWEETLPANADSPADCPAEALSAEAAPVCRAEDLPDCPAEAMSAEAAPDCRTETVQFIRNITDGTTIGFKYLKAENITKITLVLRGTGRGTFAVVLDTPENPETLGTCRVSLGEDGRRQDAWTDCPAEISWSGVHALYLRYQGTGSLDLKEITFA